MQQSCSYPRHTKQTPKASFADVLASSWDDGDPSCSSSSLSSPSEACFSPSMPSSCQDTQAGKAMRIQRSRQRGGLLHMFIAVALIMLHVVAPSHAASISEESQGSQIAPETYLNAIRSFAKVVDTPPPPDPQALMPLLSRGEPVSIPRGCFRTSELLSQSSLNPWSSAFLSSGSERPLAGRGLRSELVLCPLHKSRDDPDYRVFAVSGLLEVASEALPPPLMQEATETGAAPNAQIGSIAVSSLLEQATTSEASWPVVGHDNDGYWRQRDGKLEWDPQPTEPMPLVAPHGVPSASTVAPAEQSVIGVTSPQRSPHSEGSPSNDHASAYDAWSASIGGEAAEEWLSFGAWKERHLAAEKEKEKIAEAERRAERSRRAKQQSEQAAAAAASASTEGKQSSGSSREQSSANVSKTSHSTAAEQRTAWSEMQTSPSGGASTSLPSKVSTQSSVKSSGDAASAVTPPGSQNRISSANDRSSSPPASSSASSSTSSTSSATTDTTEEPGNAVIPAVRDTSSLLQTLRHRWNFASMDCAAVVHRTNPSAKFAASILSEKKDRYMLSPCPDISGDPHGNFVIVELCDEISIDTIVLANYEFFSRMFKRFRVSASQTLKSGSSSDSENWYQLGIFRARNLRGVQVFNTSLPQNFAAPSRFFRYLRIDFLEYYGNEHYCPLSLLRVYGLTQMDDYRREEEEERRALEEANLRFAIGEAEDDSTTSDQAGLLLEGGAKAEDAPPLDLPEDSKYSSDSGLWDVLWKGKNASADSPAFSNQEGDILLSESASDPQSGLGRDNAATSLHAEAPPLQSAETTPDSKPHSTPVAATPQRTVSKGRSASQSAPKQPSEGSSKSSTSTREAPSAQTKTPSTSSLHGAAQPGGTPSKTKTAEPGFCTAAFRDPSFALLKTTSTRLDALVCPVSSRPSAVPSNKRSLEQSSLPRSSVVKSPADHNVSQSSGTSSAARSDKSSASVSQSSVSISESSSRPAQPSGSNAAAGGSNESIYRTIAKRLNALEANATLSMQYIEHSGQMLRDIFRAMERRQETRLGDMLQALNASNWRQIEALKRRQQVDLQRAIFEFDVHKQQTETERRALMAEVRLLTSEVMFERRMGVVQLVLVLGLVVFMMFTRGPSVSPSALQSGLAKLSATASPRGTVGKGNPLRPNVLSRSKSFGQGFEKTVSPLKHESKEATAASGDDHIGEPQTPQALARRNPIEQQSHGKIVDQRPQSSHGIISHDNRKQPSSARQERSERQQSAPAEISSPGGPLSDAIQPPAGFAEMSPTELKAYLGLDSSRSASTSYDTPRQGGHKYQDETGDEGAETAMEDIEPASDDALDEFDKMTKNDRIPSVHWAGGENLQRSGRDNHFSPSRIGYRRAASAEPGASLEENSPRPQREIPASQGASPLRNNSPRSQPPNDTDLSRMSSDHHLADDKILDILNKAGAAVTSSRASNGTQGGRSKGAASGLRQSPDSDASDDEAGSGSDAGGYPWQSVPLRRKSTQTGHSGQAAQQYAAGRGDFAAEGGSDVGHRSPGSVPLGRQRSANGRKSWVSGPNGGKGSVTPTGSGLGSSILLGESLHANRPARSASGSFVRSPVSGHRARQPSLSNVKAPTPRSSSPLAGEARRQSLTTLAAVAGGGMRSTAASPLVPPYPSAAKESNGSLGSEAVGQSDWGQRHRSASATFVDKSR